jgi:hypothetical protein
MQQRLGSVQYLDLRLFAQTVGYHFHTRELQIQPTMSAILAANSGPQLIFNAPDQWGHNPFPRHSFAT